MTNNSFSKARKSKCKSFIIENSLILKEYALQNSESYGAGIIVVNLLLLETENPKNIKQLNLLDCHSDKLSEPTVHQPITYIPQNNFWFKMINLKIQKKHQIDLQAKINTDEICIVFIKDDAIEYFSVYTIKNKKESKAIAD